ncbi:hypothetical protein RJ640_021973, partial [Escallonia rubra]
MSSSAEMFDAPPPATVTFGEPWPEFNDGLTYRDQVRTSDSGMTLIEFYSSKHKNSAPLQGWLQRIENGQITIDGIVVTDTKTVLRPGSVLGYHRLPWKEFSAPYLLEVLYEDDHLIALNKPSCLQVLPGGLFQQRTVLSQLQWHARKENSSGARHESHPVPVHRLGRGTSGILLCAKTKLAKTRLASYFAEGTADIGGNRSTKPELGEKGNILKKYRALVSGILDEDEVVIKQPIGTLQYPGVAKGFSEGTENSDRLPLFSALNVLVEIKSGRPHQIRIHLSFIGHPLIGDPLYVTGGQPKCFDPESLDESFAHDGGYRRPVNPVPGDCGYHLHAHQLALIHPMTNK